MIKWDTSLGGSHIQCLFTWCNANQYATNYLVVPSNGLVNQLANWSNNTQIFLRKKYNNAKNENLRLQRKYQNMGGGMLLSSYRFGPSNTKMKNHLNLAKRPRC